MPAASNGIIKGTGVIYGANKTTWEPQGLSGRQRLTSSCRQCCCCVCQMGHAEHRPLRAPQKVKCQRTSRECWAGQGGGEMSLGETLGFDDVVLWTIYLSSRGQLTSHGHTSTTITQTFYTSLQSITLPRSSSGKWRPRHAERQMPRATLRSSLLN